MALQTHCLLAANQHLMSLYLCAKSDQLLADFGASASLHWLLQAASTRICFAAGSLQSKYPAAVQLAEDCSHYKVECFLGHHLGSVQVTAQHMT